jgi:osmotically-inducible protein OsmY
MFALRARLSTTIRYSGVSLLILACLVFTGCFSGVYTGASLIYDRHNLYKQVSDFQLGASARRLLYKDSLLKCQHCIIDIEVFNGDVLIAGHVPSKELRLQVNKRLSHLSGYRRLFIQLSISQKFGNDIQDSWITAKIRSSIIADSDINPKQFKVMTADQIVYLMGDVLVNQAKKVIQIARKTAGVKRVVTLLQYYHLSVKEEVVDKAAI